MIPLIEARIQWADLKQKFSDVSRDFLFLTKGSNYTTEQALSAIAIYRTAHDHLVKMQAMLEKSYPHIANPKEPFFRSPWTIGKF